MDFKTSLTHENNDDHKVQVNASAGLREGVDVVGAYVQNLAKADLNSVDVWEAALTNAKEWALESLDRCRGGDLNPGPSRPNCMGCDMRLVSWFLAS